MCAKSCALLALLSIGVSRPAHAGTWKFTCTGSGKATFTVTGSQPQTTTWVAPSSSTGTSYSIPSFVSPSQGDNSSGPNVTASAVTDVSATVTLTWTHGVGQTDANDPAPPSVMLIESSSATWQGIGSDGNGAPVLGTGKADDGIKDAEVPNPATGTVTGGLSSSANAPKGLVPPSHWTPHAVSGGVVTLTPLVFHANASATVGAIRGGYSAEANLGGYTVTIHAQPYNFHRVGNGVDNGDGTLSWVYDWNSTSGSLGDIKPGCTIYEWVSYDGNSTGTYYPGPHYPGPPAAYAFPHPPVGPTASGMISATYNPTILPNPNVPSGVASAGGMTDIQDKPYSFVASASCVAAAWISKQTYKFDDTDTGQKQVVVPGPGAGPMTITRTVYFVGTPPAVPKWYYTVNKSGLTSAPFLIP